MVLQGTIFQLWKLMCVCGICTYMSVDNLYSLHIEASVNFCVSSIPASFSAFPPFAP